MRHIDSETPAARYGFSFAWEGPYGYALELLRRIGARPGLVLDLGCGFAAISEPLIERGFEYVGCDIDEQALANLTKRGLEAHALDLMRIEELPEAVADLAAGRSVAAVLLLDVIEHMPATREFLKAVRAAAERLGRPPLVVSVPNVAHVDVAAKLSFGRWEYTGSGLLDSTHLQLFTSERLQEETSQCGFVEVDANDFTLPVSDQHFPADHPALAAGSPAAQTVRMWRQAADQHGHTIQFVRALLPTDTQAPQPPLPAAAPPSLSVVMRTQGKRPIHLRDALTCLAAQTVEDFDVLLMVHADDPDLLLSPVRELVAEFDPSFSSRVRVIPVPGGGRARPLNAALDRLSADYVAFLDDDDLVTADWVETFGARMGDGAIVRSIAAVRHVSVSEEGHRAAYILDSPLEFRYPADFDRVHHLWGNETPICTFAVPRSLIKTLSLRFDEELPVLEDWDFLMRCVVFAEVRDTRRVTSIYQMWRTGESSASLHDESLWVATQRVLQDRRRTQPVVLPAGASDGLITTSERLHEFTAMRKRLEESEANARAHFAVADRLGHELGLVSQELARVGREYQGVVGSRRWRVLGPVATVWKLARRVHGHLQRRRAP
jgi:SAM-dependent methyltransferase